MVWEATFLLRILYKFSVSKEVQTLANLFHVYISCVIFFFDIFGVSGAVSRGGRGREEEV